MQALRLKLHQNTAVYRNPVSGEIVESYPLPPPSTVLGLISSVLKQQELQNGSFNLSIQGDYGALMRDYQWYKKYNEAIGGYQDRRYPLLVHTLFDVNLLIHVYATDANVIDKLEALFQCPPYFLYLGRAEDIIKIEEAKVVEIKKQKMMKSFTLSSNAYIQPKDANAMKVGGIIYHLTSYAKLMPLTIRKQTKLIRDFDWVELHYIEKDSTTNSYIEIGDDSESKIECWSDDESLLWWSLPNPIL